MNELEQGQHVVVSEDTRTILNNGVIAALNTLQNYLRQSIDADLLEEAKIFSEFNQELQELQQFTNHLETSIPVEGHVREADISLIYDDNPYPVSQAALHLTDDEVDTIGNLEFEGGFPRTKREIPNSPY